MGFLDLVFPKRCVVCKKQGNYLCANCFARLSFDTKSLCLVCNKPSFNGLTHPFCKSKLAIDGCFSALSYNKTAQKLIYKFKYNPFLSDLKSVLGNLFIESIIQNEDFVRQVANEKWLMVPIPLSSSKLRKRGYNQSEILAKVLARAFKLKTTSILRRVRDTRTQVGLSNLDRKLNVKDTFVIKNGQIKIENEFIFLVDDVVTTGSTLKEAARVLKRNGAKKVIGLTLARD